jgi:hypothetical protein
MVSQTGEALLAARQVLLVKKGFMAGRVVAVAAA